MTGKILRYLALSVVFLFAALQHAPAQNKSLVRTIRQSLDEAGKQYMAMDASLPDSLMPRTSAREGRLITCPPGWWTSGFFPGSLWYLYAYSHDPALKNLAEKRMAILLNQQFNTNDHDIGFKMNCPYGNALRITGNADYKAVLIQSARSLVQRFNPTVGAIRSWGNKDDQLNFLVIIDNMMNLELLFNATRLSGDSLFYQVAVKHANTTMKNHFRADGSSWHVLEYDPNTGEVTRKRTQQGFSDSSAWSRGQAWGLYGYTMCFRETGDSAYLQQAMRIASFLLNNPNLPADKIPYWDYNAPDKPQALRDASAAAIMASALLELSGYVAGPLKKKYYHDAEIILQHLSKPPYRAEPGTNNNFLLKHSVGSLPDKSEVDVPLSYADYYYIEACLRYLGVGGGD